MWGGVLTVVHGQGMAKGRRSAIHLASTKFPQS